MSTIQPRTAKVKIYQGDHLDNIRHIEARYDAAVKSEGQTTRTLDEVPPSFAIAEEHRVALEAAEEDAIEVTLGAIGRKGWRSLVAEHKPRPDNETDEQLGVNEETFKDILVPMSILSPELSEDDLDALSDIDFDRLFLAAFALNRAPAASPKALPSPVSRESQKSDAN